MYWDFNKRASSWLYEKHLADINGRGIKPLDLESRLGAYYTTRNCCHGTVSYVVHVTIGEIYKYLGPFSEEKLGRVFNDKRALALYHDSVYSPSNKFMAQIEYCYWSNALEEDKSSLGASLAVLFQPDTHNYLQMLLPEVVRC